MHGIYQIVPNDWTGATEEPELHSSAVASYENPFGTEDLADARTLPYWRDPELPEGWTFGWASSGGLSDPAYGYCATYLTEPRPSPLHAGELRRIRGVEVCGYHAGARLDVELASWLDGSSVAETRTIAGRPARITYSPLGPNHNRLAYISVWVYDAATESEYFLIGDGRLRGDDVDPVIAIARSLFESPLPSATTFRYDTYDTTGEVAEPGSYAFLADPADTTSAVTTYEALRDGTTTALLIHKSDAHGASQAALYDAVEAGDLFEWREADDCFVRYKVTEVKPDPTGTVPRKLLAVEWMTYAFTGCSGAVSASAVATVDWGELPDLGGASLTVPHHARHLPDRSGELGRGS